VTVHAPVPLVEPSRLDEDLAQLASLIDDTVPGYTRQALTDIDIAGRQWVLRRFRDAGLDSSIDAAGNVIGILPGANPAAGTLMAGSHTDTVEGGGRFDGNVGVVAALEAVRTLRETGTSLTHDLMVIDFFAEEPNRFGLSCLGSRALMGHLSAADLDRRDEHGTRLGDALPGAGLNAADMLSAAAETGTIRAFLELHIEQGPYLEAHGSQIGLVTSITGITRFRGLFSGRRDHAGTTPMSHRRDAGCAAAGTVLAIEAIASSHPDGRGTTGAVTFSPTAVNVITETATVTGEFRSPDLDWLADAACQLDVAAQAQASQRGVELQLDWIPSESPALMDTPLLDICAGITDDLGLRQSRLYSGAEHDAAIIAKHIPTAMIFIPSQHGRSHCPEEFTHAAEIVDGATVLLNALIRIDRAATAGLAR
jgi:N-carbamoyl-L-amino-acid hydrolase